MDASGMIKRLGGSVGGRAAVTWGLLRGVSTLGNWWALRRAAVRTGLPVLGAALAAFTPSATAQTNFDECGQLVQGVECVLFRASADGRRYVMDDRGEFNVGDRVRIRGIVQSDCVSICQEGSGCIEVAAIGYCDGEISACGVLAQGVECVVFEDAKGFLFTLDRTEGFAAGDAVRVTGNFTTNCATVCQQTTGCITVRSIVAGPEDGNCDNDDAPGSPICSAIGGLLLSAAAAPLLLQRQPARVND